MVDTPRTEEHMVTSTPNVKSSPTKEAWSSPDNNLQKNLIKEMPSEEMETSGLVSYESTTLVTESSMFSEKQSEAKPRQVNKREKRRREFHRQSSIFQSILVDWEIPFDRLQFESKPLTGGRFGTTCYLGKWHGECNIRRFDVEEERGKSDVQMRYIKQFKEELMNYKKTRHDNVELFLGACLKPPSLAIVTRNYRGWRLDKHMADHAPSLQHARMIAEHVCQGLGYLHSKNIVHRDLRPANVMFDQAGKVVIKGLGLTTLAAITGEGAIRWDEEKKEFTLGIPNDWVTRLAPELAQDIPVEIDTSIIPKLKYTTESDIFAFGVLWSELMNASDRFHSFGRRHSGELIVLDNPPTSGCLETRLFDCGLGNKPELSPELQDTARNIVNKCCDRMSSERPDTSQLAELLAKVQSKNSRITRRGVSSPSLIRDRRKTSFQFPSIPRNQLRRIERIEENGFFEALK